MTPFRLPSSFLFVALSLTVASAGCSSSDSGGGAAPGTGGASSDGGGGTPTGGGKSSGGAGGKASGGGGTSGGGKSSGGAGGKASGGGGGISSSGAGGGSTGGAAGAPDLDSGAGDGSLDASSPLDGSESDSAVSPLPDGGCNSLVNTASPVEITNVAAPLPSLGGGTLVPGTYFVTKFETYTGSGGAAGPTGSFFQETAILTNDQVIFVLATGSQDGGLNPVQHVLANFVAAGTSLTVEPLCGLVGQIVEPYAAASPSGGPTTLTVIVNGNDVLTLTKQ